jgi:hypothetical protein
MNPGSLSVEQVPTVPRAYIARQVGSRLAALTEEAESLPNSGSNIPLPITTATATSGALRNGFDHYARGIKELTSPLSD